MELSMASLTAEQKLLLAAGPGQVVHPAPQWKFTSLSEFVELANNFYLMFLNMDGMPDGFRDIYRKRPAFQRFAILFPEQVAEIEAVLEATGRRMCADNASRLHEAYQLMVQLVDCGDAAVYAPDFWPASRHIDHQGVDLLYLCR